MYWISVPSIEEMEADATESKGDIKQMVKETEDKLFALGFNYNTNTEQISFVFKTSELKEAKEVAKKANEIMAREYELLGWNWEPMSISVVRQPYCKKCNTLQRFSMMECRDCGGDVEEKEYIEWY